MKFQYYSNSIQSSKAIGYVTIDKFIQSTANPKPEVKKRFLDIVDASTNGDLKRKAELKVGLFSFTPCVNVSEFRRYADIIAFTGLLVLDFDKIPNAIEFKEYLFTSYDFIFAAWLSPSKQGVKAFVNIPIVKTPDEFKEYFFGIASEMEQYNGFDPTGQNCVLPLFQSWDPDLLFRTTAKYWDVKGFKKNSFSKIPIPITPINQDSKHVKIILKIIDTGIDKITENGHPQLRGLCAAIGGYIANNYIEFQTAINYIDNKIVGNGYLKKGISGYQKTARWAINSGIQSPLHLEDRT